MPLQNFRLIPPPCRIYKYYLSIIYEYNSHKIVEQIGLFSTSRDIQCRNSTIKDFCPKGYILFLNFIKLLVCIIRVYFPITTLRYYCPRPVDKIPCDVGYYCPVGVAAQIACPFGALTCPMKSLSNPSVGILCLLLTTVIFSAFFIYRYVSRSYAVYVGL